MLICASNIGWDVRHDREMYGFLSRQDRGLEIAPTRLFPDPYSDLDRARVCARALKDVYGLAIPSMQSILYGVKNNIFSSREDREILLEHLKRAADFARSMGIENMVFGCPKNRNIPRDMDRDRALDIAADFFRRAGRYAHSRGTRIALEPNPVIYGTNFLNTARETFRFVRELGEEGVKVNLDAGALIYNGETPDVIRGYADLINHVHISMPGLSPVEETPEYRSLALALKEAGYNRRVSVEMSNAGDTEKVKKAALYVKELFGSLRQPALR